MTRENIKKELLKKKASLILAGTMALTSFAGCTAKTNTSDTQTPTTTSTTTTIETTTDDTTVVNIPEVSEKAIASDEYRDHAKAVAASMYEANKDYFDDKLFTAEDIENAYYVINDKYYNKDGNMLMDSAQLNRTVDFIGELYGTNSDYLELIQKESDLRHGYITYDEYQEEFKAYKLYNYSISLSNLIDENEDNNDVREFANFYSNSMIEVYKNLEAGVDLQELPDDFSVVRSAQAGDITKYKGLNKYLSDNTANDGLGLIVALMFRAPADYLNASIDGHYVIDPATNESVRVGFSYEEQMLVDSVIYYGDNINDPELILKARELETELYQRHLTDIVCIKREKIFRISGDPEAIVKGSSKTYSN